MSIAYSVPIDLGQLPDEIEPLKAIIVALKGQVDSLTAQLEAFQHQFLNLRRLHFGARSEQLAAQPDLLAATVSLPVPPRETETVIYERARRGRPALPKTLPRERIEYA